MVKRGVEVEIFGQRYTLRSEFSEEQVREVATYVDGKMKEVEKGTKTASTLHIAILAALNIAQEYLREKGETNKLLQRIEEKAERLEEFIDLQIG